MREWWRARSECALQDQMFNSISLATAIGPTSNSAKAGTLIKSNGAKVIGFDLEANMVGGAGTHDHFT